MSEENASLRRRVAAAKEAIFVGSFTQRGRFFQNFRCGDRRNGDPEAVAQILQEQIVSGGRFVGIHAMAEARLRRRASNAHDERGFAARAVIWVGVRPFKKNGIELFDGVHIARVNAEKNTWLHVELIRVDIVLRHIEFEKNLARRQEIFFGRGDGGRVIKHHVIGVVDGIENVALVAFDRGHKFVRIHESPNEQRHVASINDAVEHKLLLQSDNESERLADVFARKA